ncbi:MAG: YceI family protein [Polyangiaceae bacterium]
MRSLSFGAVALGCLVSAGFGLTSMAHAAVTKTEGANVAFTAVGPGGLKIVGTTNQLSVKDSGSDYVVSVPLATLDTKIELRNKHMREKYLQTDKFPNAEIVVAKADVKPGSADANGTLKIHGKEKAIRFHYEAKKNGAVTQVTSTFKVNIEDFGIEKPSFMGATVKSDVDVAAAFAITEN